jgi:hypothetical protein
VAAVLGAGCEREDSQEVVLPPAVEEIVEEPTGPAMRLVTSRPVDVAAADSGASAQPPAKPVDAQVPITSAEAYPAAPLPGKVELSQASSLPGYTLLTFPKESRSELLDHEGKVVHTWSSPDTRHWDYAELLGNGDLILTGSVPAQTQRPVPDASRLIMRLSWDGQVVWRTDIAAYGNVTLAPKGRLCVLTYNQRVIEATDPTIPVHDNILTMLSNDGKVVDQISLHDVVAADPAQFPLKPTEPREFPDRKWIDVLRVNSVDWIDNEALAARDPLYAPTNVVIACQDQDRVAIVNTETRKVVWAWGDGELESPHSSVMLDNGNVMIFDNGIRRRWSRVLEVDPIKSEIVWQYSAKRKRTFLTPGRGSCQRLSNGNTLICSSDRGSAFEVTPAGDVAWQFSAASDPRAPGRLRAMANAVRYDSATIEAWIKNHSSAD